MLHMIIGEGLVFQQYRWVNIFYHVKFTQMEKATKVENLGYNLASFLCYSESFTKK